jgi:hypothetical protein
MLRNIRQDNSFCPFCGCLALATYILVFGGGTHNNDKIRAMVDISVLCVATQKIKCIGFTYFRKNGSPLNFKGHRVLRLTAGDEGGMLFRNFESEWPFCLTAQKTWILKNPIIHLVVCLTTGPKPLPNRVLHIVRSSASSFKCEYPLLSLRSSSSVLRFLPRLPVTSIPLISFLQ